MLITDKHVTDIKSTLRWSLAVLVIGLSVFPLLVVAMAKGSEKPTNVTVDATVTIDEDW